MTAVSGFSTSHSSTSPGVTSMELPTLSTLESRTSAAGAAHDDVTQQPAALRHDADGSARGLARSAGTPAGRPGEYTPMQLGLDMRWFFTARAGRQQLLAQRRVRRHRPRRSRHSPRARTARAPPSPARPPRSAAWSVGTATRKVVDRLVDLRKVGHRGNAIDLLRVGVHGVQTVVPAELAAVRGECADRQTRCVCSDVPATAIVRGANSRVKSVGGGAFSTLPVRRGRSGACRARPCPPVGVTRTGLHSSSTSWSPSSGCEPVGTRERHQDLLRACPGRVQDLPRNPASAAALPGSLAYQLTCVVLVERARRSATESSSPRNVPPRPSATTSPKGSRRTTPTMSSTPGLELDTAPRPGNPSV